MALRFPALRGGGTAAAILAALALAALANVAAAKFPVRWDWTESGLYTLSEESRRAAAGLDRDVRIVSFLVDGGPVSPDALRQIDSLLEAYRQANPKRVTLERIDPRRDPLRAQALLKEFGLDPLRDSIDVVVVESGARRKQIRLLDMVEFDAGAPSSGTPPVRALKVEPAVTGALTAVTRAKRPTVYFAAGHGERDPLAAAEPGLSRFAAGLEREDVAVAPWNAVGATEVPKDADLVVVAGPTSPWLPAERDALTRYLEGGGRALLLLEPTLRRGGDALVDDGLGPLLARFGVAEDADVVVDPGRGVPFLGPETFYAETLGLHPVTSALRGQPVLFVLARSLRAAKPGPANVVVHSLAESSDASWGETDLAHLRQVALDKNDLKGPLPLALAAERERGGRLLAVGDVDSFSNLAFDRLANGSFALNAADWLLDEGSALGLRPKDRRLARLFLTGPQLDALFATLVLLLPAMAVGAGLYVWARRRGGGRAR